MTRSSDFGVTVKQGVRATEPDLVVHVRRAEGATSGPRVGLVVAKSVGNAVQRHRVSRRLRHVAAKLLPDIDTAAQIVIRALPNSQRASSARLERQLRSGLQRTRVLSDPDTVDDD